VEKIANAIEHKGGSKGLGKNMEQLFTQLRLLSEARFPNSGHRVVASLFISRFLVCVCLNPKP
jgi:hypothetical protein